MVFTDIKSMLFSELRQDFLNSSYKKFRAIQVYAWLTKGVKNFCEMTDIPKEFQEVLEQKYKILNVSIEKKMISKSDGTIKYLFKLFDGNFVEAVLLKYKYGFSICISTQVGCKMNCAFCATGKIGFKRNLSSSEMLSQIQEVQDDLKIRISNVVLMGMGEPFDNYENTIKFLKIVTSKESLNIGVRHISVSTCGIASKILEFSEENLGATLSLSLHASNDEIRNKIIPMNKKWNILQNINACKQYILKTNRRVLIEYAMIKDLNDSAENARELCSILKGMLCHVNLIPLNNIVVNDESYNFEKSSDVALKKFMNILYDKKISFTVRRTLGSDINASCGQLVGNRTLL
ncbi:putative dual-specificity RNA methyltransferase RlmN [Clostridia bacterium]|nr:putative dual-specificity RNA methyltransferase RlmN [Clostridia bacterium]